MTQHFFMAARGMGSLGHLLVKAYGRYGCKQHGLGLGAVSRVCTGVGQHSYIHRHQHTVVSTVDSKDQLQTSYDAVIIGAGHNGLITAAYLQGCGLNVCVLEKRHVIGGAAVTEEIIPGFKFSRASYLLSLLRPQIINELELKRHGLQWYLRDPSSYTPLITPGGYGGKGYSLTLGRDPKQNHAEIAKFSKTDAEKYGAYEDTLAKIVEALEVLIDNPPFTLQTNHNARWSHRYHNYRRMVTVARAVAGLGSDMLTFYELLTAPASKVLDKWFESEPLKATLATDAVIGAMSSPRTPGSGYVLLHHVMGELDGVKGAWAYVRGGMGAVSDAIARAARSRGAGVFTDHKVSEILIEDNKAIGVLLADGREVKADVVISNATPHCTFNKLLPQDVTLPADFQTDLNNFDYTSPVTKINVAVNRLPVFAADPQYHTTAGPPHMGTIHLNSEHSDLIHQAYLSALNGQLPDRPVIEMTIPSSVDDTVAPEGCHVVQLFTQYTPYTLANNQPWTQELREQYTNIVLSNIEEYIPGFQSSIVGIDVLTPPDLERIFGLTGGNIFHGAMGLDQLYMMRPSTAVSPYHTPIMGMYMCGSGTHPGGGVMGLPGKLAAHVIVDDKRRGITP